MKKSYLYHRGCRRGCAIGCSPHVRQRFPRGWEGQGSTRVRLRAARRPRKRLRVPFSTLGAILSVHLGSSESSTSLGSSRVDQGCMQQFFCRGRRQWAQAISYPPTPEGFRRVGSWRRGSSRAELVGEPSLESSGGGGLTVKRWDPRHRGGGDPLQPARSPALPEGLGVPWLDQGARQGGQESFRDPRKRFRVPFSTLEALLSAIEAPGRH